MKRINLISGPRNVSTALMYSFSQRRDTTVIDEPLYAHYLKITGIDHPGRDEVLDYQSADPDSVIENVIFGEYSTPVLFIKNMAHHLVQTDASFLKKLESVILIRDPCEMLPSLIKQIPEPTLNDTAYEYQYELFKKLQNGSNTPPVVDAGELLKDPESVLEQLCERLDIPWDENMLHWEPGPIQEDGIWAKHWYQSVHKSSGFRKWQPKKEKVPDRLSNLLEQCNYFYSFLYSFAIKAKSKS